MFHCSPLPPTLEFPDPAPRSPSFLVSRGGEGAMTRTRRKEAPSAGKRELAEGARGFTKRLGINSN